MPVPDLQFSPRLVWQVGAESGKNHIQTPVKKESQRAQQLRSPAFVLPAIGLDWLSNRRLKNIAHL